MIVNPTAIHHRCKKNVPKKINKKFEKSSLDARKPIAFPVQ